MSRRSLIANSYGVGFRQGEPSPCFTPDFSGDNELYEEIDSLNEISVAQSKSHLSDICALRLREQNVGPSFKASDDVIMDNIISKTLDTNQLMQYAHGLEYEILNENNKDS